ncbi:MAG: hypothetical protein M1814_002202 [Vezdaea aestivalis]|nr:MAG: hypothetical protein M1814_002202 [Vezdaea aestivalis]
MTKMLENGSSLTPLTTLTNATAKEMFARSINALWKTPTSNKIYITFLNLEDPTNEKCGNDASGPRDSQYYSEQGVYCLYNWIEQPGLGIGSYLYYPWSALGLPSLVFSLPDVDRLSVKYNFDQSTGTKFILGDAVTKPDSLMGILNGPGCLPGTWTILVCDMQTYGADWNLDHVSKANINNIKAVIPCPDGKQHNGWPQLGW